MDSGHAAQARMRAAGQEQGKRLVSLVACCDGEHRHVLREEGLHAQDNRNTTAQSAELCQPDPKP